MSIWRDQMIFPIWERKYRSMYALPKILSIQFVIYKKNWLWDITWQFCFFHPFPRDRVDGMDGSGQLKRHCTVFSLRLAIQAAITVQTKHNFWLRRIPKTWHLQGPKPLPIEFPADDTTSWWSPLARLHDKKMHTDTQGQALASECIEKSTSKSSMETPSRDHSIFSQVGHEAILLFRISPATPRARDTSQVDQLIEYKSILRSTRRRFRGSRTFFGIIPGNIEHFT